MAEFAQYYISFLTSLFSNIGVYFKERWIPFGNIFTDDVESYIDELSSAVPNFGIAGWICYVLVLLINFTCVFFICYRIFQLIRRYIGFRAKEVEKDELLEEIAKERDKVAKLTIEKNQLYALKINNAYPTLKQETPLIAASSAEKTSVSTELVPQATRFAKLTAIDQKYAVMPPFTSTVESDAVSLKHIVDQFVNFSASRLKLYYHKPAVRAFFAGMATTKVLILEGISGTGKTSLPYALGKFFDNPASMISIQPSFRDRGDLIGYLNEFTKTFNETDFLASLYESTYREDVSLIVLDEMNLARIEYYFAEFLSIMEMPDHDEWNVDVVPNSASGDPKHLTDGKLRVPLGLWFVGTANQDDSTFTITDKVYDRTVTIDLNDRADYFDAPLTESIHLPYEYLELLFQKAQMDNQVSEKVLKNLLSVDEFIIAKFKVTFGNRILKQIMNFIPVYVACGGTELEAVDFLLMSKIFRKFNSLNLVFLKKELQDLITLLDKLFGKGKCPVSVEYIKQLIRRA